MEDYRMDRICKTCGERYGEHEGDNCTLMLGKFSENSPLLIKYKVCNPFSIIDIYEKAPCSGEYSALLRSHQNRKIEAAWSEFASIKQSKVLMRNLDWLEKNGFITKKKEEWVNVYLDKGNRSYVGNFEFASKEEAESESAPKDHIRYVGAVLKN